MSGTNRDEARPRGDQAADQPTPWDVDRCALWTWMAEALDGLSTARLSIDGLKMLCAGTLDTHAPAVLVHAQAAGIALEHLIAAGIVHGYVDRYGPTSGAYEVARLRVVVRSLRQEAGREA